MDILSFGLESAYQGDERGGVLDRNLKALSRTCPAVCAQIRATPARTDVEFIETDEDAPSARLLGDGGSGRLLASARRPLTEARRLGESVDVESSAGLAVLGFGLGLHVKEVAARLGKTGVILCFEPDVALLRSVLERVDHSEWIEKSNLMILTDEQDRPAMSAAMSGLEGVVALGFEIVAHPPSKARLGDASDTFCQNLTRVLSAVRTSVVTTLVQGETTLRNLLMNADHYVANTGIAGLKNTRAGRPAIVVSAGPSLERAMDTLAQPGLHDRVVIIAVQTVLRPLLARGIRPHYVTALDHHEISRRFYEGLTSEDVEGVTLIAEPKANPAILDAFPGLVRTPGDDLLDEALGASLTRDMGRTEAGATVAHLAHYFARYLGCDPVILVGQDLAFTDGQYYSAGAAIHDVWAPELGPFRTLETLEWERIVRMRSLLRKVPAQGGGEVYSDEQMTTYLAQFEAMFGHDAQRGLRTIDTCAGGALKRSVEVMTLDEALAAFAPPGSAPAETDKDPAQIDTDARLRSVRERLGQVRRDASAIGALSAKTEEALDEMLESQRDQGRVNKLIARVNALRDEVMGLQPAFRLTQFINQTGALNRMRADRAIEVASHETPLERQRRQIERDRTNVSWIREASGALVRLLDAAIGAHAGRAPKLTSDPAPAADSARVTGGIGVKRVAAIVPVCEAMGGLGTARDLSTELVAGLNPLRMCVERLLRAKGLDEIVLLSGEPDRARALLGATASNPRVAIERADGGEIEARRRGVGGGRIWSKESWRGGIGALVAADEAFEPRMAQQVMERRGIDAGVFVGDDWALVDPGLTDQIVERYRSAPESLRIVITQAPPGLCGVLLDRSGVASLSEAREQAGSLASIGGLVGYLPIAPQGDPIAKPVCVQIPAPLRSLGVRAIPDSDARRRHIAAALAPFGGGALDVGLDELTRALAVLPLATPELPEHVTLELCSGRLLGGEWGAQLRGSAEPIEREMLPIAAIHTLLGEIAAATNDTTLTLHGAGDPLMHPRALEVVRMAREIGFGGVHLRTDLARLGDDEEGIDALLRSGVDVISVDLLAVTGETYRQLTGTERFEAVDAGLRRLLEMRRDLGTNAGMERPWIVPRITRCAAALPEIERFHDAWIMACGASVIDPAAHAMGGERIRPLPIPAWRAAQLQRDSVTILSDGTIEGGAFGARVGAGESLAEIWASSRRSAREGSEAMIEPKPGRASAGRAA